MMLQIWNIFLFETYVEHKHTFLLHCCGYITLHMKYTCIIMLLQIQLVTYTSELLTVGSFQRKRLRVWYDPVLLWEKNINLKFS